MHESKIVALSLLSTLLATAAVAPAQTGVVSPADRASLEGSTFTHFPLGRFDCRMQTLHRDLPGGTVITGHAYRREASGLYGNVAPFSAELEVTLSMSPNTPDQASATFAQNVGSSPIVVLTRTPITFPGTARPALDPAPSFDLVIPYQTPFAVPAGGGTLCVDVVVHGNVTANGTDKNFSAYLDGHRLYANGDTEQPGFRFGTGCAAAGNTATTTAAITLWHLGTSMSLDLALRNGIPELGSGLTRAWVALGTTPGAQVWPQLPQCALYSSNDIWFELPGLLTSQGSYDGTLSQLPVLPPDFRLWLQAGSAHLGTGNLSFSDGVTLVTPPAGPTPIPAIRIVNSTNRTAPTGTISDSVPVIEFR
ncbi:MAG: hypothetical protein KDE27_32560 [Planctomycetes bacterium]|nr:hypothetical protein [Planctomycetota bacterium]